MIGKYTPRTDNTTPGYWLVRDSDKSRFFISANINEGALNKVCDRVLSDKDGWGYWIDRSLGMNIQGTHIAWVNIDHTDLFI
jgi:hypothetical protein